MIHLLQRPRPPCATGSVDCCHTVSTNLTIFCRCVSSECSRMHVELPSLKSRRGIERYFRRRKKAGWASIDTSRLGIAERRSTTLGTTVRQPLTSVGAPRLPRSSRALTVTPGRADSFANMTRLRLATLTTLSGDGLHKHFPPDRRWWRRRSAKCASVDHHGVQPTGCMDNEPEPSRGVPC